MTLRRRRLGLAACALMLVVHARATFGADTVPLPSVVVLDFELIEDYPNAVMAADQARRIAAIGRQLRDGLAQAGLYRVVDELPVRALIEELRGRHAWLYSCVDCAQQIGRAAHSDLVLVGWVQKVSELILNVNVELREVASERVVLIKSVDLRGNTDESWQRGVRFMLRDWAERRASEPRYGR